MTTKNIAVIASRMKCVDAVSIDAEKWIDKYNNLGYALHLISGKFGEPVELTNFEIPELDYKHPEIRGVKRILFSSKLDKYGKKAANILLNNLVRRIKQPLKNYIVKNKIDLLHVEDVLLSFKNMPLNIAILEIIKELNIPTITRHHYFYWDLPYFTKFKNMPHLFDNTNLKLKNIIHITNSEFDRKILAEKKEIKSTVIPNVINTEMIAKIDEYNKDFRESLGINKDALLFLQPTRVKRNKCIEKSIKIVSEMNSINKKENALVITGSPVYSRGNYFEEIVKKASKQKVKIIFANDKIFISRHQNKDKKFYSLNDSYVHADVVLYPNTSAAFGNPLLEAVAHSKPVVVNQYPKLNELLDQGFNFIVMDQKVTSEVLSDIYEMLNDDSKRQKLIKNNLDILKNNFSTDVLDDKIIPILNQLEQEGFIKRITNKIIPQRFRGSKSNEKTQGTQKNIQKKKN